jgi:hypothetical protein
VDLMDRRRRLAAGALLLGLGLTSLASVGPGPRIGPLLDGVFIEDPFRWADPPAGAAGDPTSAQATQPVVDGAVPLLAVATSEVPPQAQVIAQADAFAIADGTESVTVSIVPSAGTDAAIAGNVYTFSVTDAAGAPIGIRPEATVTIVVRASEPNLVAQIARFDGTDWVAMPTEYGGLPDLFAANITELGDFAVLVTDPSATGSVAPATASPAASAGAGDGRSGEGLPVWLIVVLVVVAIGGGLAWGLLGNRDRG